MHVQETVRRRKDGTLFDISLSVSPLVDDDGKVVGASKSARDITERKRIEQELRRMLRIGACASEASGASVAA